MKYRLIFISVIVFNLVTFSKQNNHIKLSGDVISSESSQSSNVNNAFDGDFSTVFKSSKPSNGWIGLKLDSKFTISRVGVAFPNNAKKEEYLLGIFEGANDPSFFESNPIFMITEELELGKINYFEIKSNIKYQYIRYIGPNNSSCIISGLEIYRDEETETNNEEAYYYQLTNLPLIVINTENSVEPYDKENYINCNVLIVKDNKKDTEAKGKIKYRGNATFRFDKKPYRIKFENKEKPLDMPAKAKSWTLLANYMDKTLIRNLVALKISTLFEMKYTPECKPVDLIVNGEFKGSFDLCDQVEEGKKRIEVTKMDETCINEPEITGGYVLAADEWARRNNESHYVSNKGVVYKMKYPEVNQQQEKYITNYFNLVEEECYNNTVDRIDLETFCKYFLIEDLCGNGEAFWSTYMTKERDDDKIYFGPAWDFGIAFGNDKRHHFILKKDFVFKNGTSAGTMKELALNIISNEKSIAKLKEIWKKYSEKTVKKKEIIKFVNEKIKEIDQSQKLNFMRWDILNTAVLVNPVARGSFEAEVEYLKEFIQQRYAITDEIVKKATRDSIMSKEEPKEENKKSIFTNFYYSLIILSAIGVAIFYFLTNLLISLFTKLFR